MQLCIRVVNSHIMAKFQWQLFLHFKGFGTILWIELEKCSVCANIAKPKQQTEPTQERPLAQTISSVILAT